MANDYSVTVTVGIPVTLTFDEPPTRAELEQAALENFLEHPALKNVADLKGYVDSIVSETEPQPAAAPAPEPQPAPKVYAARRKWLHEQLDGTCATCGNEYKIEKKPGRYVAFERDGDDIMWVLTGETWEALQNEINWSTTSRTDVSAWDIDKNEERAISFKATIL